MSITTHFKGQHTTMIIPYYWAESRIQNKLPKRQITVRRWGWSDISQEDAQALADERAKEAMDRLLSGDDLRRRELNAPYDAGDGVPIREEVVARHGETVITRNSYGSLCLNTSNVFFADVDSFSPVERGCSLSGCYVSIIIGIIVGALLRSPLIGFLIFGAGTWGYVTIARAIDKRRRPELERVAKEKSLAAVRSFVSTHLDWHLRVYETPAGYRLLAMHSTFEPTGEPASTALAELQSDAKFAMLCRVQGCFRARVSPKYWRMKRKPPLSLPKSKWPFPKEHIPRRQQWVQAYDDEAGNYAACRFIEELGSKEVNAEAETVRQLHDAYCRAMTTLPLA